MDELEALASIYGDDWKVVDAGQRVYSIDITDGELQLSLQVRYTILWFSNWSLSNLIEPLSFNN